MVVQDIAIDGNCDRVGPAVASQSAAVEVRTSLLQAIVDKWVEFQGHFDCFTGELDAKCGSK